MRHLVRVRRGVVLLAAVVAAACSGGSTPAQDAQPAAAPATSAAPVERVTEYPRPAKPSKTYRIGIAVPHLSNPHYIGQAYGYLDEAEQLGVQATLLEAGGLYARLHGQTVEGADDESVGGELLEDDRWVEP